MRGTPIVVLLSLVVCGCGPSGESSRSAKNSAKSEGGGIAQSVIGAASAPLPAAGAEPGTAIAFVDAPLIGDAVVRKWLPLPEKLSMYALEGTVEESAEMARDDDLLTEWSCFLSPDSVCNLALTFPQPATVTGIRLFGGSGVSRKERQRFARPRQLKIRTEAGWINAELKDTWDYQHILLPATLTRAIRVEIVSVYPGENDNPLIIPEFEVFGSDGLRRAPLVLDGIQVLGFGWRLWEGTEDGKETTTPIWIDLIDGKEGSRRLLRGSGWIAAPEGRFAIVPELQGASCPGAYYVTTSRYTLVDMAARMFYSAPLHSGGEKSVIAGDDGRSFAHGVYDVAQDAWLFGRRSLRRNRQLLQRFPLAGRSISGSRRKRSGVFSMIVSERRVVAANSGCIIRTPRMFPGGWWRWERWICLFSVKCAAKSPVWCSP
jgi:hypothetical protein